MFTSKSFHSGSVSAMESSDDDFAEAPESQMGFVTMIANYPEIFKRSQTPASRKAKTRAYQKIQAAYERNAGQKITLNQLLKKVHNMKTRVKQKMDVGRSGNRKIVLKDWEKALLRLLEGGASTAINTSPGVFVIGRNSVACTDPSEIEQDAVPSPPISRASSSVQLQEPPKKRKNAILDVYETDETKRLSLDELQRLVLLKHLRVLDLKEEKLIRERNADASMLREDAASHFNLR